MPTPRQTRHSRISPPSTPSKHTLPDGVVLGTVIRDFAPQVDRDGDSPDVLGLSDSEPFGTQDKGKEVLGLGTGPGAGLASVSVSGWVDVGVPPNANNDSVGVLETSMRTSPSVGAGAPQPSTAAPETAISQKKPAARKSTRGKTPIDPRQGAITPAAILSPRKSTRKQDASLSQPSKKHSQHQQPKSIERRVLPQRIRRAAGGGVEGMRDVEEMIVDWVQRWGEPVTTPPDCLSVLITTMPLSFLNPAPSTLPSTHQTQNAPPITLTPSRLITVPASAPAPAPASTDNASVTPRIVDHNAKHRLGKEEMIETPGWVMVLPGEDDEEEAREELESGVGTRHGKGLISPMKRLRKGHDEPEEDTSDAYYTNLHRRYEALERRQRLREKEKLQFERYKMSSRMDLLRNLPKPTWAGIVGTILGRGGEEWVEGKEKVEKEGEEWLRGRLLREGEEVMRRYDELLPPESRKKPNQYTSGRSTPRISTTPEPTVLPARVAALRDPTSGVSHKRKRANSTKTMVDGKEDEEEQVPNKPERSSRAGRRQSRVLKEPLVDDQLSAPGSILGTAPTPSQTYPTKSNHTPSNPAPSSLHPHPQLPTNLPLAPTTPYLLEAASRRSSALEEAQQSKALMGEQKGKGRLMRYEKTRISERLGLVSPFGMPMPGVVEFKSEFTLTDEEDFWPIIAEREALANRQRRGTLFGLDGGFSSIGNGNGNGNGNGTGTESGSGPGSGSGFSAWSGDDAVGFENVALAGFGVDEAVRMTSGMEKIENGGVVL